MGSPDQLDRLQVQADPRVILRKAGNRMQLVAPKFRFQRVPWANQLTIFMPSPAGAIQLGYRHVPGIGQFSFSLRRVAHFIMDGWTL